MVRTDSDSRQNRRPDVVTHDCHVSAEAIEPIVRLGNLFAKEDARAVCNDEAPLRGPQIRRNRAASRCARAPLTGAGERPGGPCVRPSGKSKGETPSPNASEPMALGEPSHVPWLNRFDWPVIDFPIRNQPRFDELEKPRDTGWLDFVVIRAHSLSPLGREAAGVQELLTERG